MSEEEPLDLTGDDAQGEGDIEKEKRPERGRRQKSESPKERPSASESDLRKRIADGLGELAELLEKRDPELAEKVRSDTPRMAEVLATHAAKRPLVAKVVKRLFGKDSAIAILRAFGPTSRTLFDRLPKPGARREGEEDVEGEARVVYPPS